VADRGLVLRASDLAELVERAVAAEPEECCGVLIGRFLPEGERRVARTVAAENAWPGDRRERYEIPPATLLETMKLARLEGLEVVGYYHSHPRSEARPRAFDRERAWPDLSYHILAPSAQPVARSWRLDGAGEFCEEPDAIEGGGGAGATMRP